MTTQTFYLQMVPKGIHPDEERKQIVKALIAGEDNVAISRKIVNNLNEKSDKK